MAKVDAVVRGKLTTLPGGAMELETACSAARVLSPETVIRNFRITKREVLQDAGEITAEIAKAHAESGFEKYRIVQTACLKVTLTGY